MLAVRAFWGATEAGALPPDTVKGRLQQRTNDSEAEMRAAVTTARASHRFTGHRAVAKRHSLNAQQGKLL